jgi:gliding motility-associated-like protein
MSDGNNCHADTTVTLTEPDSIKLNYQITQPYCPDKPEGQIVLNVTGGVPGSDYMYVWSDNSSSSSLTDIPAGKYKVTVSDLNGCSETESIKVEPLNETCLGIPNAISPNGDLINDVWKIELIDLYPNVEITIYNRWGETVWQSAKGYPVPWDGRSNGRILPVDSYHYIIDLHNGSKLIIGNVTVVR